MTSTEETKYIILPTVAVAIIAAIMFSGSGTPSKAVEQSSLPQSVSKAAVATPVSSVSQPVREEPKLVVKELINIKGIYIGMAESEYRSLIDASHAELKRQCRASNGDQWAYLCNDPYTDTITLGGVKTQLYPKIEQGVLKSVSAGYLRDSDGDSYLKVKQAIQSKYTDLKCDTNEVRNRMNAAFEAQVCWYNDGKSQMRIAFRDGSVDYSTFQLFDVAWSKEQRAKESAKVSKDI
jgi:hypothetical protein